MITIETTTLKEGNVVYKYDHGKVIEFIIHKLEYSTVTVLVGPDFKNGDKISGFLYEKFEGNENRWFGNSISEAYHIANNAMLERLENSLSEITYVYEDLRDLAKSWAHDL